MKKRVFLIFSFFSIIFLMATVNASKEYFFLYNNDFPVELIDYGDSPYSSFIGIGGNTWYQIGIQGTFKVGRYYFEFIGRYPPNLSEYISNLSSKEMYHTENRFDNSDGYITYFTFTEENGNIFHGSFNGKTELEKNRIRVYGVPYFVDKNGKEIIGSNMNILIDFNDDGQILHSSISITNGWLYDTEQRISALESWKQTIEDTISQIWLAITGLTTKNDEQDDRIEALENQPINPNITIPDYWKYLSSSDRKKIACGVGEDNHLAHIELLGWKCDITYRQTSRGETASCRCKKL